MHLSRYHEFPAARHATRRCAVRGRHAFRSAAGDRGFGGAVSFIIFAPSVGVSGIVFPSGCGAVRVWRSRRPGAASWPGRASIPSSARACPRIATRTSRCRPGSGAVVGKRDLHQLWLRRSLFAQATRLVYGFAQGSSFDPLHRRTPVRMPQTHRLAAILPLPCGFDASGREQRVERCLLCRSAANPDAG